MTVHDYVKMRLLKACITAYKMDIICLSETNVYSRTQLDGEYLEIPGYTSVRSDHPSSNKQGGVCTHFKTSLALRVIQKQSPEVFCLRPAILLKKRFWHRCFPVNFVKFLGTSFFQNTSGRLLLVIDICLLQQCICFEVMIGEKLLNFAILYW